MDHQIQNHLCICMKWKYLSGWHPVMRVLLRQSLHQSKGTRRPATFWGAVFIHTVHNHTFLTTRNIQTPLHPAAAFQTPGVTFSGRNMILYIVRLPILFSRHPPCLTSIYWRLPRKKMEVTSRSQMVRTNSIYSHNCIGKTPLMLFGRIIILDIILKPL